MRIFLTGLLVLSLASNPIAACSCAPKPSPKEALETASAVFVGKVTKIVKGKRESTVTMSVDRHWKGNLEESVELTNVYSNCDYTFIDGETYLVYAYKDEDRHWTTSICMRTVDIESAKEDLKELGEPKK